MKKSFFVTYQHFYWQFHFIKKVGTFEQNLPHLQIHQKSVKY